MSEPRRPQRRSRVPTGRLERLVRIGWLTGEIALGGAAEGLRRIGGGAPSPSSVFLTGAAGRRLASRLSTMRGAAMKLGQLLSLEADDLLPPEVTEALSVLRAEGDAMPRSQLRRVLGRNWGKGWEQRFASFDFEPIAAASIGQVHAAVTRDGRELALKIQYPGVASSIDSDVDNLAALLRLARVLPGDVDFSLVLAEAKHQLRREADYQTEAEQLRRYRALLSDDPEFVVPRVHDDFTTSRILAMDRLRGVPLEDACGSDHTDARRDALCALLLRLVLRELFEFGFMQSDPNFANYLLLPDGRVALLDLGAGYEIPPALSSGYARLFRAAADQNRGELKRVAQEIGFIAASDTPAQAEAIVDLMLLATEPLQHRGVY
ncbi:MAG: AarF/ABC1/UbiB kinase family protein, partial [Myxococcales bacterium]|nr:AarF/ABC1/UbiB kinase family protein [Myxococcales bacterium]